MRVSKIQINNIGPFDEITWDIDTSKNVVILCGQHGLGKTTILECINHNLSSFFKKGTIYQPPKSIQSCLMGVGTINLDIFASHKREHFFKSKKLSILTNIEYESQRFSNKKERLIDGHVAFAYISPDKPFQESINYPEVHFSYRRPGKEMHVNYNSVPYSPYNLIDVTCATFEFIEQFFNRLSKKERNEKLKILSDILFEALNWKLTINNDKLLLKKFCENKDLPRPIGYLSNGENYAIVVLIIGLFIISESGILILDSPEVNLHPKAQNIIIEKLASRLKNGQIIVATHSPSLISLNLNQAIYTILDKNRIKNLDHIDATVVIRDLYGDETCDNLSKRISLDLTSKYLKYLLECSFSPKIATRLEGDPQIQQLATWLNGFIQSHSERRISLVDFGAGTGDLLAAIEKSGCADRILYIPIEKDETKWNKIEENVKKIIDFPFVKPEKDLSKVSKTDLFFIVNTFHELDLDLKINVLHQALRLTSQNGFIIIHEVAILPKGESDFIMWSGDDFKRILTKTTFKEGDIMIADTYTRPNGWPLFTVCIKSSNSIPSLKRLMDAAHSSIDDIIAHWSSDYDNLKNDVMSCNERPELNAFYSVQLGNLCLAKFKISAKKMN
jgi:predicted ATPase